MKNEYGEDFITIIYNFSGIMNHLIFGHNFVVNNKENCKLVYEGKEYDLRENIIHIRRNYRERYLFSIKLTGINKITDASYMFFKSYALRELPDISKWNTSKVESMNCMFYKCYNLMAFDGLSEWDTSNVT